MVDAAQELPPLGSSPTLLGNAAATLPLIPAIAAASVAILYAVGALLLTAEVTGAGLTPGETLPLVPLQQILARGVGTVVAGVVVVPGLGLTLLAVIRMDRQPTRARPRGWTVPRMCALLVGTLLALTGLALLPPATAAATIITVAVLAIVGHLNPPSMLTLYFVLDSAALVLLIASAFIYPPPLARATIELDEGSTLRGGLVAHGDGTWVLSTRRRHLTAIPDEGVRIVSVEQLEHHVRSVYEIITGHRPLLRG